MPKPFKKQEWVSEDPDELFAKTVEQLIREMPEDVAVQVYNRVGVNGEPYMLIHGRADGALLLQRMTVHAGIIKGPAKATVAKKMKA